MRDALLQQSWQHFPPWMNSARGYRSHEFNSVPAAPTN